MSDQIAQNIANSRQLKHAPLIRVLCQIRWHLFPAFEPSQVAEKIAKTLSGSYPIGESQHEYEVVFNQDGPREAKGEIIYQLSSIDRMWKITLGKTFITLETKDYSGHEVFIKRLGEVIVALNEAYPVPAWLRIGFRYTNRITGDHDLAMLEKFFNNTGVLGGRDSSRPGFELLQSVTESIYKVEENTLLVRSASLAPNATIDPTLESVDSDSWLLDLDAFFESKSTESLNVSAISAKAEELAGVAYDHFRGIISDEFIARFG